MEGSNSALPFEEFEKVYDVARSLLPAAIALIRRSRLDPAVAEDCLMEAAHYVVKKLQGKEGGINNLPGYLFATYKHLVLAKLRESKRVQHLDEAEWTSIPSDMDVSGDVERRILLAEIVKQMDPQTRFIYDHLVLGYTYQEIAREFNDAFNRNVKENALRSKFSKAVQRIAGKMEA